MDDEPLKSLHTSLIDAIDGYNKAIAEADEPDVRALFEEAKAHHRAAHSDIHRSLVAKGEKADDSGSFMGTVHKAVISARATVTGLGESSLSSFADGEERLADGYDQAIEAETQASTVAMLHGHKAKVVATAQKMKAKSE